MVNWPFKLISLAVLLTLALIIGYGFWGYSYDDAFITYRYADNLARGQGLTYNPGEDVLGTTAPGYAVALGLLARVTGSLGVGVPQWGTVGSLVALGVVSLVPLLMPPGAGAGRRERLALPLLLGPLALSLQWNVELLGAETLAVLALVAAAALLALVWERPAAAGALSALAMLFRLDAGLAAASVGCVSWWRRKRFPVTFAVAGLVPVACGLAWLHFRFGTFLPNSLAGKQAEYGVHAVRYTLAEWSWLRRTLPLHACLSLLALALAGAVALARRGQWRHPLLLALGLWLFAHEVFYRLVRVPFAPWYHVGLLNGLLFLAVWGALAVAAGLVPLLLPARRRRPPGAVATLGCAALLLMPIGLASVRYLHAHWRQPPDPRYRIYAEVGRHLARRPGPGRVVAVEIGVVGYFSRRPILDLVGLVSPEALAARQSGRLPALVADLGPRFIVDVPLHRPAYPILEPPELAAQYRPIATFEDPPSGRGRIRLLERSPPRSQQREKAMRTTVLLADDHKIITRRLAAVRRQPELWNRALVVRLLLAEEGLRFECPRDGLRYAALAKEIADGDQTAFAGPPRPPPGAQALTLCRGKILPKVDGPSKRCLREGGWRGPAAARAGEHRCHREPVRLLGTVPISSVFNEIGGAIGE